jgi:hypothetical protein
MPFLCIFKRPESPIIAILLVTTAALWALVMMSLSAWLKGGVAPLAEE